jgi:hypothetical protein
VFALNIPVTRASIDAIKLELAKTLSTVKSSHRCEAIARGLGYRTYATLLATVDAVTPAIAAVQASVFCDYLSAHGFDVSPLSFYRAAARVAMRGAMAKASKLTAYGIGIGEPRRKADGKWESSQELKDKFDRERADLLTDRTIQAFLLSIAFLSRVERTGTVRPNSNSYWLKHIAENYVCTLPEGERLGPYYVPNGALIAAAVHLGFLVKTHVDPDTGRDSLNATFNMSKVSLTGLDEEIRQDGARAQARRRREEDRAPLRLHRVSPNAGRDSRGAHSGEFAVAGQSLGSRQDHARRSD